VRLRKPVDQPILWPAKFALEMIKREESLICAALRGENPDWPRDAGDTFVASFLERIAYHGVEGLLYQHVQVGHLKGWPESVLRTCRTASITRALWECAHSAVIKRALGRLNDAEILPIIFKGTALAYNVYLSPWLRRRGDTDLIVPFDRRDQAARELEAAGFVCEDGPRGDLTSYQVAYTYIAQYMYPHTVDLHWRINDSQVLSNILTYQELWENRRALPTLCPHAVAAGSVHALFLACMHRAGHRQSPYFVGNVEYYGGDRLIWVYDIHLILREFDSISYNEFTALANRKGLAQICSEGLLEARDCFGATIPEEVFQTLAIAGSDGMASQYLSASVGKQYLMNFMAVDGIVNKLRFIGQISLPPRRYMRRVYSRVRLRWLPWLYARRALVEISKRLRRTVWSAPLQKR
jgi:Uncharacterised nucleotidyltransferase